MRRKTMAQIMRQRRVALMLTPSEAARRAGMSRQQWYEYETGRHAPANLSVLVRIAHSLRLPLAIPWPR
jgi:DNA-binding XRE family transcriptional regulator